MTALADHPRYSAPSADLAAWEFAPVDTQTPDECELPAVLPASIVESSRRKKSGKGSTLFAFTIAAAVHAAAIAVGLRYATAPAYRPPTLVLPQGWATEFHGTSDAGTPSILRPATPLDLPVPPASTANALPPMTLPPGDLEPVNVTPPPITLNPDSGTSDFGPLPPLGVDTAAPAVTFRHPPGGATSAGSDTPTRNTAATVATAVSLPSPTGGSASVGAGDGDGGGPQGVPDGLPVPSTRNKKPVYPDTARRKGWTGTVQLELDLDAAGRVTAARLLRSSGFDLLDGAALDAAQGWTYAPATLNGRPVPVTVPVPIVFGLEPRRR
jgi:protein TonB